MRRLSGLVALLVAVSGGAAPVAAQGHEGEVLKVVNRLFNAMRAKDTAELRAVFDTAARVVITTNNQAGAPVMTMLPIARFITAVGGSQEVPDERIWDSEVRIDDNLATVWTKYEFLRGGQFSHCGMDSFQLVRTTAGWKIVHIVDTQRRGEGCWRAPAKQ